MSSMKLRFNKASLAAIPMPASGQRVEYQDTDQPGLRLRVSSTGVKTFLVIARIKGGPVERITIGRVDKLTPENARTRAKQIIAKLAMGESQNAEARAKRGEMTLGELVTDYIELTPMKPRSRAVYKDLLRLYVQDQLGKSKISDVSSKKLATLHRQSSKRSETSANRALSLIKASFNWAKTSSLWTGGNPADGIKKNPENSRTRYLQPKELAAFFEALNDTAQPGRDFFLMALLTGARKSNVLAMRWSDVDLDAAIWRIPAADAKAGDEMSIPLTTEALVLLQTRKDAKESPVWVFPAESKSGHYEEPKRAWATLRTRAKLEDLRIHDLRRTMGSWLVRTGANTAINAKALGHKSLQAASVYQRIADTDPVREAMQRATTGFMGDKVKTAKPGGGSSRAKKAARSGGKNTLPA